MKFIVVLFAMLAAYTVDAQKNPYLLIGTYTSGKSEGIYVYNFNTATADNSFVSTTKTSNPGYLAISPNQKMVYAANENREKMGVDGDISAYSFDKEKGVLTEVNKLASGGKDPAYVSIDKSGKWLFVANYSGGSTALFSVKKDGPLDSMKQLIRDRGNGPNKARQEAPHVHSAMLSPDNKFLFTPDLGADKVMIYRFDKDNGRLSPAKPSYARSVPGSGPRHFDFHPNNKYVYLMEELTGTVVVFKYSLGKLDSIQRVSALPAGFKGVIGSADIHVYPNGKFLYCSNRGESNSITIFKINDKTGKLKVAGYQSTMGKTPRNFNFDPSGNFLLVANQDSGDIVIFKIDKKTGLLTDTGKRINVPDPICIKWITSK